MREGGRERAKEGESRFRHPLIEVFAEEKERGNWKREKKGLSISLFIVTGRRGKEERKRRAKRKEEKEGRRGDPSPYRGRGEKGKEECEKEGKKKKRRDFKGLFALGGGKKEKTKRKGDVVAFITFFSRGREREWKGGGGGR